MKKIFLLTTLVLFALGLSLNVNAQSPEDLVVDPECSEYVAASKGDREPPCNKVCQRKCVEDPSTGGCIYQRPDECNFFNFDADFPEVADTVVPSFNPFDIELCPNAAQRPDDDPYCTLSLVRLGFYAAISLIVFVSVVMGFWVVWERSTAGDNSEKIEKSSVIARNAILGLLIAMFFLAIVQLAALLVGLTGNIFEFSIVPEPRVVPVGGRCDVGNVVCEPGASCELGFGDEYYCEI